MQNVTDIKNDIELFDEARLFYGEEIPNISLSIDGLNFTVTIDGKAHKFDYSDNVYNAIPTDHKIKRLSKIAVYDAISCHTGQNMPWGALTGVRPTKLFYECLSHGKTNAEAVDIMQKVYRVELQRALILRRIVFAQTDKIFYPPEYVNLYVHIPFCTTRCNYCSFISMPINKHQNLAEEYTNKLITEIEETVKCLNYNNKRILSVYIGGGTPTALNANCLEKILKAVGHINVEYTVEAGRPDTIDEQKIKLLKEYNVTRVCVNPQTLCENTLLKIGRNHSVKDFYEKFDLVSKYNFDINCDLIAGLSDEKLDDFINSYERIKQLAPQNVTVHSLSKKNGSALRYDKNENLATEQMLNYVLNNVGEYRPYYLYRQKRQAGNLENIGLSIPSKECINNITTMEETVSVVACGAGAISKKITYGTIMRHANLRDVNLYINQFDERLQKKLEFFCQ